MRKKRVKISILKQIWDEKFTRYILVHGQSSVFLDTYPEVQGSFGGTAFIWGLYVDKDNRRNGMGRALLMEAEELAKREGHATVVLKWELGKNSPRDILNWYIRSGYSIAGHYREEQYTLEKELC